jgi:hypothetical protein
LEQKPGEITIQRDGLSIEIEGLKTTIAELRAKLNGTGLSPPQTAYTCHRTLNQRLWLCHP